MHNLEKTKVVLFNYRRFYPRSLNESLTPHVSLAPNHPQVDPYHIDDRILRKMNAADYCEWVRYVVRQMRIFESGLYSSILHNKFLVMTKVTDEFQCRKMEIGRTNFYGKLNHAFKLFSQIIPEQVLDHLYRMCLKLNK